MSATESLYAAEGKQLVNELDVPIYLHHAEKRLRVRVMEEFLRRKGGGVGFWNDVFSVYPNLDVSPEIYLISPIRGKIHNFWGEMIFNRRGMIIQGNIFTPVHN